jgi:tetraacyldisaccharide 4'-kinase
VVLNSNRLAGALEAQRRGCDTVVLDDGFQHWALRRDLDIVLVDATAPFGAPNADEGHLLPYGYLREKPTALARAGVVIVTRSDCVPPERARALSERLRGFAPHALHLGARHEATELRTVGPANAEVFAPQSLSGKRILALCGIGNPAGFRRTLERLSANVVEFIALDDHHDYTRDELLQSQNRARTANADSIVVTAKDSGKIAALLTEAPGIPILELGVRFVVEDADALWAKVAECIGARN